MTIKYHIEHLRHPVYALFVHIILITAVGFLLILLSACSGNKTNTNEKIQHSTATTPDTSYRILTPDWGIAAELTAMGYPPIATGDVRMYADWVRKPKLSSKTIDMGARFQPNPEMLVQLQPDLVLDSQFYEHARHMYGTASFKTVDSYVSPDVKIVPFDHYTNQTKQIGQHIGHLQTAQDYIDKSTIFIKQAGNHLKEHQFKNLKTPPKIAVAQFVDRNNLRVYGRNSVFQPTLTLMDIEMVTLGESDTWGSATLKTADLAKLSEDVCLVIYEPFSQILQQELKESLIWQRLGYGMPASEGGRCMAVLPPIWIYGGLSASVSVAENLKNATFYGGGFNDTFIHTSVTRHQDKHLIYPFKFQSQLRTPSRTNASNPNSTQFKTNLQTHTTQLGSKESKL